MNDIKLAHFAESFHSNLAMASYAAVVSLLNLLDDVQQHSRRWILLHEQHIQSLHQRATAFLKFIEDNDYSSSRLDKSDNGSDLATQMADSSFAAENIIRSFVSAQIILQFEDTLPTDLSGFLPEAEGNGVRSLVSGRPQLVSQCEETVSSFSERIQKAIQEMDVIQEKVEEKVGEDPKTRNPQPSIAARFISPISISTMVGLDDALLEIMDRLIGQGSKLETIPIVGMGGIGKTSLALNVFHNRCVVEHFDICSWITISQEYSFRDILSTLLKSVPKYMITTDYNDEQLRKKIDIEWSVEELGENIYKTLFGRRYFIVMDDVWDIEGWYRVKKFLPDNGKGSRVLMTTRMSGIADDFGSTPSYRMGLLDESKSWEIFHDKVFSGGVVCSDELEVLGRKIVKCCGGLPLAITVIGGLLAKSDMKLENWEHVAENLNSILTLEGDDHCHKVLYLSYIYLPIELKPCFLYMSRFEEDEEIRVSRLIKLWVAEGFLKPVDDKSLEDVALESLNNLIDRNLILVQAQGVRGKVKQCGMHDLVRDLSLRESRRENFRSTKRIPWHGNVMTPCYISHNVSEFNKHVPSWSGLDNEPFMGMISKCSNDELMQLVNSRYFSYKHRSLGKGGFRFVMPLFWTLQTLILSCDNVFNLPVQFWRMTQLRHARDFEFELPEESQSEEMNSSSLVNLQTLFDVWNFRCSQQILKMFPNVKKLKLQYGKLYDGLDWSYYCLKNLVHLSKLESLRIRTSCRIPIGMISFPHSLTKLILWNTGLYWHDMSIIGSMPNLEILILAIRAIEGSEWIVNDGEFTRLKRLRMEGLDLKFWRAHSSNFPCLKRLEFWGIYLEEHPRDFEEILTLEHISLIYCSDSAQRWAKQIQKEREELDYEYVHVRCIELMRNFYA